MKRVVLIVFGILFFLHVKSQDSSIRINYDYFESKDTDSVYLVKIDSALIVRTDTIQRLVLSRYKNDSYNFLESSDSIVNKKFVNRNAIKIRKPQAQWLIYLFLGILFLYALIRNIYFKTLNVIFQAYWNDRAINQFTRDDNFFKLRNSILYFLMFAMVYGILLKIILNYYGLRLKQDDLEEYIFIGSFASLFYLGKFLIMKISGYIFSIQKLMSGYLSIIAISNFVYSIIAIPLIILYHYLDGTWASSVLYLTLILLLFNTVYKYLRTGSFIINNFQFPKFYLFLYLCSLEIMPLLIIYKMFLA